MPNDYCLQHRNRVYSIAMHLPCGHRWLRLMVLIPAELVTAPAILANSVQITIGGATAPVAYAGLVGAGLYQFNVTVPNVPNGDAAAVAQIGSAQTQAGVLITVQQ